MKHLYFFSLLLTFSFGCFAQLEVPSDLQAYYGNSIYIGDSERLEDFLKTLTTDKHTTQLTYGQRHTYLYDADANLADASEVVLMYTGEIRDEREYLSSNNTYGTQTFNTEHVFPRSYLDAAIKSIAEADLHHLRSCDVNVNSSRDNKKFANNANDGTYENLGSTWFPGDEWKGDVARMIMYINLRYDEPFTDVGTLDLFLEWNREDEVSDFEMNRNNVISAAQGNRNPFVDNPYLASLIWGGPAAENTWETLSINQLNEAQIKLFPNPASGREVTILSNKALAVEVFDILGKRVSTQNISQNQKKLNIASLKSGIYLIKLKSDESTETRKLIIK